jgi:hypothetical protein
MVELIKNITNIEIGKTISHRRPGGTPLKTLGPIVNIIETHNQAKKPLNMEARKTRHNT